MMALLCSLDCEACHRTVQVGKPDDSGPVISRYIWGF